MKIVSPEAAAGSGTRTRTLTHTLLALLPSRTEYVDGAAIVGLAAIAFVGFAGTFDSWQFYFVALLGVLLGTLTSRLAYVLRWNWLLVVPLVLAEFFLLGSVLAFRDETAFTVLPTLVSLQSLGQLAIGGWKDLLTTLPPVAGDGPFVGLPYLLGLAYGSIALPAARSKRPFVALLPPIGLLVSVILLGTAQNAFAVPMGLSFAALAFAWASWRYRQVRRLKTASGRSDRTQVVFGAGLLALAVGGGYLLGGFLPGGDTPRVVLRSYVRPPVQTEDFPSPLVGFRAYSSKQLDLFYDKPLLKVTGAAKGTLLRLAVMDDYSGLAWVAMSGAGNEGFQRIGAAIPDAPTSGTSALQITVLAGYADPSGSFASWIPSLGDTASVTFSGALAKSHAAGLRFNVSSQQGYVVDRLKADDLVTVVSAPYPTAPAGDTSPAGTPTMSPEASEFLTQASAKYLATGDTAWARLSALAKTFKDGCWTDGTVKEQEQYLPGHGERRLLNFLNGAILAGSDEQYAATLGLLASQLGYPTRVVMGAAVPTDGVVKGADVHAWVEVQTASGWVTIPPSEFLPTKPPQPPPQYRSQDRAGRYVPPPNPAKAPSNLDDVADGQLNAVAPEPPPWWTRVLAILAVVGPPIGAVALILGAILGAKALRSRRRRTRGSPADRVSGGWQDVVDQARDMGIKVPRGATRLEQSRLMVAPQAESLAADANVLVFGEQQPEVGEVAAFWQGAAATKAAMRATLSRPRRLLSRISLRSLLPERASSAAGASREAPARPTKRRGRGGPTPT